MRIIKWLIALCVGLLFILVVGVISSIFVDTGSLWYKTLRMPYFMLSPILITLMWGIIYIFYAIIIAIIIIRYRTGTLYYIIIVALNLLNILWTLSFFKLNLIAFPLIIITIQLILLYTLFFKLSRRFKYCIFVLPVIVWYTYLFIVNYHILLLN